uniref:Abnormal cell migration protein 18-like fibronectin type I domain-containing protein n=1 Tax=Parascaris univalens TaxID=6257 RepID=A0A915B6R8_PARUN
LEYLVSVAKMRMQAMLLSLVLFTFVNAIIACKHSGKIYKDGDEWKEKEVFIMRCSITENGWKTEVIACISPSGHRIPLNTTMVEGNDEWKCAVNSNGMISLQQGVNANAKCDQHNVGEKWQDKSFEFECLRGGQQKLLGCIGENKIKIPVGGVKEINGYMMKCEQFNNGTVLLHGIRKSPTYSSEDSLSVECIDSKGNHHAIGSSWIENERFNKTCTQLGRTEIHNCVTHNGFKVPINGELIHEKIKYICERTKDGAIRFASGPADNI